MDDKSCYDYDVSGKVSMKALYEKHTMSGEEIKKNIAKIYFACRERSRKVSSQCELYSDGSGVYFFTQKKKYYFCYYPPKEKKVCGKDFII